MPKPTLTYVGPCPVLQEAATQHVLVTGATGFVGRHVVRALMELGASVRATDRKHYRKAVVPKKDLEVHSMDVTDVRSVKEAMDGMDGVVHLVAIIRERGESTFESVNHQGTANVATAAREAGVRSFVQLSAIGAADDPRLPYLQSKWRGEQVVAQSGVPYTILRTSILFGKGDEFINTLAGVVKAFPVIPIAGRGDVRFQLMHVQDLARCVVQALRQEDLRSQIVEIGGPTYVTYDQIIDTIASACGRQPWNAHVPMPLMRGLVKVMERALPHPPTTSHQLRMLAHDNIAQLDTVQRVFGFTPRPLEGNIDYIHEISFLDALGICLGFMPRHIRDH